MSVELSQQRARICPPGSWQDPRTHYFALLSEPWYQGVAELMDLFQRATSDFWRDRGGRATYLPLTTGSVSSPMGLGSDSSPVRVQLANVDTYLADSMQFQLELATRVNGRPAYYVMPSFRGEPADETHLSQFFHSEAEFAGDLDDCVALVGDYVRYLASAFWAEGHDLVQRMAGGVDHLNAPFEPSAFRRLTFDEVVAELGTDSRLISTHAAGCRSLTRAGERALMERFGEFVWVTHMDHLSVPFYQAFGDSDRRTAANGDLLFGIGETVGCGERHFDVRDLRTALEMHEVDQSEYEWYSRMREMSPLRTSGFGMGVERFLLWVLNHNDIRDLPLLLRFNGMRIDP